MIKLNLGSGSQKIKGYINVDKYNTFEPDIVHDLEKFPYPFKDNSVEIIILSHVLAFLYFYYAWLSNKECSFQALIIRDLRYEITFISTCARNTPSVFFN